MSIRKILATVLSTLIIIAFLAFSAEAFYLAAHKKSSPSDPPADPNAYKVAADNLYSDNGYIDYAREVVIPLSVYDEVQDKSFTDAQEMGLFWIRFEEGHGITEIPADSEEGAALIDPNKPTLILVHGMMSDGYYNREGFFVNDTIAKEQEFGINTETDTLSRIWHNAGWNVGYFHYERLAAEGGDMFYIESKIWATDGKKVGIRYRHADNTVTDGWTDYSIAEHFAAEYIRAMNLLPESMGNKEIRVAAHSMGGQLTTATLFLLTELARTGQLPMDQLPDRFAMLDPFFSVNVEDDAGKPLATIGPNKESVGSDITIRWSGKGLPRNNTGVAMIECLKALEYYGIAMEYYAFNQSFLTLAMSNEIIAAVQRYAPFVILAPNYAQLPGKSKPFNITENGHNGVRDWYLCSLYYQPPVDTTENKIASASSTYEEILALRGKAYIQTGGNTTFTAGDDVFTQVTRARELFSIPPI